MMHVNLDIIIRSATIGRSERTGETHIAYCFWDMNGNYYKRTIGFNDLNKENRISQLIDEVSASAISKGASSISWKKNK